MKNKILFILIFLSNILIAEKWVQFDTYLIEADGIVMTAEMDIAKLVETQLSISISVNDEL